MRNSFRLAMGLALFTSLASCKKEGPESEEAQFTPKDSTAVRASADKWVSTLLARDFDGWATTITSDAVLYPPNGSPTVGRDAAVAFAKAYPTITSFVISPDEVTGRGDVAYDRGTYTTTVKLPGGASASDKGSFIGVFRRQPDGTWAHSRAMWHSDLPLPAPPKPQRGK